MSLSSLLDSLKSTYPIEYGASLSDIDLTVVDLNPEASSDSEGSRPREVARLIREYERAEPRAVYLVTLGTVAAEEIGFLLHLNLPVTGPIVLAAAQRSEDAPGSDGAANLLDAFRVAKHAEMRDIGCVLVMDGQVHSARDFRKRGSGLGDFVSLPFGPLGHVDADGVWIYRRPTRKHTRESLVNSVFEDLAHVEVVDSYIGASGDLVLSAARSGAAGVVIGGFASNGRAAASQRSAIREAQTKGVIFVAASRGLDGARVRPPKNDGLIGGDNLTPSKARVLLQLAISHGMDIGQVAEVFETH